MSRHQARETAFKMIFQMDVGQNSLEIAERTLEEAMEEKAVSPKERGFVMGLAAGVEEKREELDAFIIEHAKGWTIDRINVIEKNIIRLALYEIRYMDDIPYEVSVNEAIELAKEYGDDDAYSFVNGILDNARPPKKADAGEKK
ncbi:MAG: transcription antitermination factor NusB [Firmicutes bacterium]|nr:transcription antitermination factor NusB [Bacillota bacterium]